MLPRKAIQSFLRAKPAAVEGRPFGPGVLVYKIGGKVFAILSEGEDARLTLKCDPHLSEILRQEYAAISPGYHTNKRHWITIRQDRSLPDAKLRDLIDHSYDLVRSKAGGTLPRAARPSQGSRQAGPRKGARNQRKQPRRAP